MRVKKRSPYETYNADISVERTQLGGPFRFTAADDADGGSFVPENVGAKVRMGPTGDGGPGGTTGNSFEGVGTPNTVGSGLLVKALGSKVELGEAVTVGTSVGCADELGL